MREPEEEEEEHSTIKWGKWLRSYGGVVMILLFIKNYKQEIC